VPFGPALRLKDKVCSTGVRTVDIVRGAASSSRSPWSDLSTGGGQRTRAGKRRGSQLADSPLQGSRCGRSIIAASPEEDGEGIGRATATKPRAKIVVQGYLSFNLGAALIW